MFTVMFPLTSAPQLCESEEFWEQAVLQRCNTVSAEVASLALEVGWRSIFFTSKLQLQKMISRRRLKAEEQPEGQVSEGQDSEGQVSEGQDSEGQVSDPDISAEEQPDGQASDPDTSAEEQPEGQISDSDTSAEESPNESSQSDQMSSSEEESHPGNVWLCA